MTETGDHARGAGRASLRRQRGETVEAGACTVTPESFVLTVRLPSGQFVWQRPSAVLVRLGGRTARLPIHDATRLAQGALSGVVLLGLLARQIVRHH